MGWYLAGAVAGVAASRWLNDRKARQQAEEQLELQANAITASPISPPLPVESWFSAPGLFTIGLPAGFTKGNFSVPRGRALLMLVDSVRPGTYMAVMDRHLNIEFDAHSVWVAVVNPYGFRQAVGSWGGNVVQGPEPVLVDGERGVWSVVDSVEQGVHVRRWSVLTAHANRPYEVIMGADFPDQVAAVNSLSTAIGSWRWADSPSRPIETSVGATQVGPITPQLPLERWFDSPGEFRFGLPRNYAAPSPEARRLWEGRNGTSLLCVEDPRAYAMFLMVQRDEAIAAAAASIPMQSLWAVASDPAQFRDNAWRRSRMRVTAGPQPILIGGEEGIRFDISQVDEGTDIKQCVAQVIHRGRGYDITMFVKADVQPKYEPAFMTILGSWQWL